MSRLGQAVRSLWPRRRSIVTIDDYIAAVNSFAYQGHIYTVGGVEQTLAGEKVERAPGDFAGHARVIASNEVVFAVMSVRASVFSAARFTFQGFHGGRPSTMFGTPDLAVLETPWPGGTTQDLLLRMIQDADLAGNAYHITDTPLTRIGGDGGTEIVRLRPDYVDIALEPRLRGGKRLGWRKIGYLYYEDGHRDREPVELLLDEVSHFAPQPDPLATYRGMSWLTPLIRTIQADNLMERHKRKFFEHGATPNLVVKHRPETSFDEFKKFKAASEAKHAGVDNAYRTMYVGGGADVTVVGTNFEQMSFTSVQGRGETRIAAAGGTPPVLVGLSEGLQASTYSNYGQARRRFADGTMHPLWQNAAGSVQPLIKAPRGSRLWYDARDVAFLREDRKDAAAIQQTKAQTIARLVDAGFTPKSAVAAVEAEDNTLLEHTGLYSVQLQPPGSTQPVAPVDDQETETP